MIVKGKMWNKLLAGIMTAACVVTSMPMGVLAEGIVDEAVTEEIVIGEDSDALPADEAVAEETISEDTTVEDEVTDVVEADDANTNITADNIANAVEIQLGTPVSGTAVDDNQYSYKFTATKTGVYTFTAEADKDMTYYITDLDKPGYPKESNGALDYYQHDKKVTGDDSILNLVEGTTYYIIVFKSANGEVGYKFTVAFDGLEVKASDRENPEDIKIDGKTKYEGTLYPNFREDGYEYKYVDDGSIEFGAHYYHLNIPDGKNGRLTFATESSENGVYYRINDIKDFTVTAQTKFSWTKRHGSDDISKGKETYTIDLIPGDYYLQAMSLTGESSYSFTMSLAEIKLAKDELPCFDTKLGGSNNEIEDSVDIDVDQKYIAQSTVDNENKQDWYRFTLSQASPLYVNLFTNEVGAVSWGVMYTSSNYTDDVSLYGETPRVFAPTGVAMLDKNVNTGESSTVLYSSSADWQSKKPSVFPAGTYYFYLTKGNGQPIDGYGNSINGTGAYRFEISTGPKVNVSAVKMIDTTTNKAAAAKYTMVLNQSKIFKAEVTPEKAEQTVTWSTSDPLTATVENGVVTPVRKGIVTITVTTAGKKKDGKAAEASCQIEILDKTIDNNEIICQPEQNVAFKEKVNLISADYFGEDFKTDKTDVWVVKNAETGAIDKSLGSVKNGVFTGGKKSGTVKVVRQIKLGKDLIESGSVVFDVEVPAYLKKDPAKPTKDLKTLNVTKKCTESEAIDISEYVGCPTLQPDKYEIPAKAKGFSISDDGKLEVTGSGTCKVTVYWGYDATAKKPAANAAKIVFTVKSKLPTVKGKATIGANKTVAFKITNTPKNVKFEDVPAWRIEGVDNEGNPDGVEVNESIATGEASTDGMSYNVTGAGAGKIAVIVTIDGIDYWTISQVK